MLAARLASNSNDSDAIDKAILTAAADTGDMDYHVNRFTPFDPVSKRTEATATHEGVTTPFSKGAPQVILDLVHQDKNTRKRLEDAAATIATARSMGLQIKIITGDHEAIARQIAGKLGLGRNIQSAGAIF